MRGKSRSFARSAATLFLVFAPGIALAQTSFITSTPVTRTINVYRLNGNTTAFINGAQVSVPYHQNGVTISFHNNTLFTQSFQSGGF